MIAYFVVKEMLSIAIVFWCFLFIRIKDLLPNKNYGYRDEKHYVTLFMIALMGGWFLAPVFVAMIVNYYITQYKNKKNKE